MKRDALIELGLTEEQADKVIEGYGIMIPKSRLDTKIQENADLKQQITDRDTQLTNLQSIAGDNEALKQQITTLQQENAQTKTEFEGKLQQRDFDHALDGALRDAKAKNPKAVKALLNTDAIKIVDGQLVGLDEQLTALKTSDDYLFVADGLKGKTPPATPPGGKAQVTKEQFAAMSIVEKTELYNSDYELYKSLTE